MTKTTAIAITLALLACGSDEDQPPPMTYADVCSTLATASCDRYEACDVWIQGLDGSLVFPWTEDERSTCESEAWWVCLDAYDTSGVDAPVDPHDVTECLLQSSLIDACEQPPPVCIEVCKAIGNQTHAEIFDSPGDLYIWVTCNAAE